VRERVDGAAGALRLCVRDQRLYCSFRLCELRVVLAMVVPSVFGRNLQCQPARGVNTRVEWHRSHASSLEHMLASSEQMV
jgi:hypothetical protein